MLNGGVWIVRARMVDVVSDKWSVRAACQVLVWSVELAVRRAGVDVERRRVRTTC